MSSRTLRTLQTLLLLGLGLFFLEKVWAGTVFWYINQRFAFLVVFAGVGFLILASLVRPTRRPATEDHAHEGHTHDHQHDHDHPTMSRWGLAIVAVPLLLGVLVPARPLGSAAIANKGLNLSAPLTASEGQLLQLEMASTERNVLDWVRAFNYAADVNLYTGQAADVVGFIYHDPNQPADEFMVSRFAVTCCSADATAIGMVVQWPAASKLTDNTWVRVRGPIDSVIFAGRPTPRILAETVEGVVAPEQPYLYP